MPHHANRATGLLHQQQMASNRGHPSILEIQSWTPINPGIGLNIEGFDPGGFDPGHP
jgi:hypothetical protein